MPRKMIYDCSFKTQLGETRCERVEAVSKNDAMRIVQQKHAGAILLTLPTLSADQETESLSKKKGKHLGGEKFSISFVRCLLFGVCSVLFGALILFLWFIGKKIYDRHDEAKDTSIITEELGVDLPRYKDVCRYVVSISTKHSKGTGFLLNDKGSVYLYTCLHCITDYDVITAHDSQGRLLELNNLEMCEGRDLVRFRIDEVEGGLFMADGNEVTPNVSVFAYGDTMGGGVMTENKGKILAVGNEKIEISSEVLQGNSGGPVVLENGKVVGVVSSGSVNNTIFAKDTRYEKVRKFAERIDGGIWFDANYEDYRLCIGTLIDTMTMVGEIRDFTLKMIENTGKTCIGRPFINESKYVCRKDFSAKVAAMYSAWDKHVEDSLAADKLLNETGGYVGNALQVNGVNTKLKAVIAWDRQAGVLIPRAALDLAASELKAIDYAMLVDTRDNVLNDIENVLIPGTEEMDKLISKREKKLYEAYMHDYKNSK